MKYTKCTIHELKYEDVFLDTVWCSEAELSLKVLTNTRILLLYTAAVMKKAFIIMTWYEINLATREIQ